MHRLFRRADHADGDACPGVAHRLSAVCVDAQPAGEAANPATIRAANLNMMRLRIEVAGWQR